jgi:hypothetical protein
MKDLIQEGRKLQETFKSSIRYYKPFRKRPETYDEIAQAYMDAANFDFELTIGPSTRYDRVCFLSHSDRPLDGEALCGARMRASGGDDPSERGKIQLIGRASDGRYYPLTKHLTMSEYLKVKKIIIDKGCGFKMRPQSF